MTEQAQFSIFRQVKISKEKFALIYKLKTRLPFAFFQKDYIPIMRILLLIHSWQPVHVFAGRLFLQLKVGNAPLHLITYHGKLQNVHKKYF